MPQLLAVETWLNHDVIFWGAIVLICVVPSISYYLYRWRKTELDAELKREMLARGMSADEIERVLAAGSQVVSDRRRDRRLDETQPHSGG
jgi:hypothetical protein